MAEVPEYALYDQSNHLLAPVDTVFTAGVIQTVSGPRAALTFRTPCTTLTVVLDKIEGGAWRDQLIRVMQELPGPGDDDGEEVPG